MSGWTVVVQWRPFFSGMTFAAAVMITPHAAVGQASTATIEGTVRSQPGAPVVGAEAEGQGTRAVTDADGRFRLVVVSGSPTVLTVSARGYSPTRIALGALTAGSMRSISVVLTSLATLDAVSVVAPRVRPLLNTENAVTGGSIEARELTSLPTDARDPIALLYNIPGITQATGFFGDAPRLSFNGGNSLYSQNLLDGLDNNEGFLGGPRVDVPLGAIARMDALVNTYSTQLGRSPDGLVNITSAAGRARLTGDAFVYQRPGRPFDARVPVTFGAERNALAAKQEGFQRVQAGGSLRGAFNPTRTFFATAIEYTREQEDRIGSTAQAQFLGTERRQTWKGYGRFDHGWTPTQTTTLRVAASAVDRAGDGSGVLTPEADITTRRVGSLSALIHRSALRDGRASNTASAQVGTFRWNFPPARSNFSRPQVTVLSPDLSTQAIVGSSNFVFDESERQWQLRDVFETAIGDRHTLRLGGDVIAGAFRLTAASTNPNGSYVVINSGNILAKPGSPLSITDIPANARVQSYTIDARPQQVNLSQALYSAFAEDTWRPTPSLTVVGGLRWDYDDLTSRGESDPDLDNVQPRLSFNWSRTEQDVFRGGVGRYAGKLPYAIYSDAIQLGASGNSVLTFSGASAPAFGAGPLPANIPNADVQSVPREIFRTFALGLEQPMSWQTTLGYQRQFGRAWALSADLVWSETRNLPWTADLNPIARRLTAADSVPRLCASSLSCQGDASRPNSPATSGYRRLSTAQSGGSARYVAMYVTGRRALTERWQLDANWVWSRAQNNTEDINFSATQGNCFDTSRIDAVTGAACTSDEWADANNDRRHRLTVRSVYESSRGFTVSMIGDGQTGVPLNRLAGAVTSSGIARYDLLGSGSIRGNSFIGNADRFFGVARNAERLPGFATIGASASYRPRLPALRGLELRADAFNLLNTLAWGGYANGIGGGGSRTQLGRPNDPIYLFSAAPPRQFQFSARYLFGDRGAR
ncbi:carboxypeptidase regulatory-like domain-containing protein [Gemmatimonas sp.]|uniref:TonB-dependent receptor n=1 Tax=Gemmatimonas sp. TaxID=1962908 RepID=UPI003983D067